MHKTILNANGEKKNLQAWVNIHNNLAGIKQGTINIEKEKKIIIIIELQQTFE